MSHDETLRGLYAVLARHEINEREDEDPDEVHEVPEEAQDLYLARIAIIEAAFRSLPSRDREVHHAAEHVHAMEARDQEEGRSVSGMTERQAALDQPWEAEEAEVVDEEVLETASVEEAIDMTVASEETEDEIVHVRANLREWVNSYVLKTEQGESE